MSTPPPIDPEDDPLIVPPSQPDEVDVRAVHEEERVRVLADGSVVREVDRIEQTSSFRDRLPWILLALAAVIIVVGGVVWYATRSSSKTVPAVVGLRIDAAVTRLQADGFKVQLQRQSNPRPAGVVFGQNPAAATSHGDGSTVHLLVSKGRGSTRVPNAVGLGQSAAGDRLVQAGFRVITSEVFSDQRPGSVVAQTPAAGGNEPPGTLIHLNVSKGSATVDVPSEVGNTVDQARSELAAKGLVPSILRVPSSQPLDTVVAQNPTGGQVRKGARVELNVSKGAAVATAPAQTTTTQTVITQTTTTTDTVTAPPPSTTSATTTSTSP
jgi:beta-lactam-binding protein with PASTA domain